MSACPRSYGVSLDVPVSEVMNHPYNQKTDHPTQIVIARGQLKWLIEKSELILSNDIKEATYTFTKNFTARGGKTGSLPIYACDDDNDLPGQLYSARNGS